MKGEIEFRGRTAKGEWVYGYHAKFRNYKNEVYSAIIPKDEETGEAYMEDLHPVIPETVGQFTGLTDKNGKKIFEGDIVKVRYVEKRKYLGTRYDNEFDLIEKIIYAEESAQFMLEMDCDGVPMYRPLNDFDMNNVKIKTFEVIGTIFDKESDNGD